VFAGVDIGGTKTAVVLSKVRALFGHRLQMALSGAAPISHDVLEFFDACGIVVFEGYGLYKGDTGGWKGPTGERR